MAPQDAAWALARTAAVAGGLGLMLWAALDFVAPKPGAAFVLVILLAAPSGVLLAWKTAEELRSGVHITWRAAVGRRERPVAYWLAVGFEGCGAASLFALTAYAVIRLRP